MQKNYKEAHQALTESARIIRKALGASHEDVGRCYFYLGQMYMAKNESRNAELKLNKALTIFEKGLGHLHPIREKCLDELADSLTAQGKTEESKLAKKRADAIRAKRKKTQTNNSSPQGSAKAESPGTPKPGAATGKVNPPESNSPKPEVPATGK